MQKDLYAVKLVGTLLLLSLLSGCTASPAGGASPVEALPTEEECQPQTENWLPSCPRLYLKEYYLHPIDVRFNIDQEKRVRLEMSLWAWSDVAVEILKIEGLAGHNRVQNASMEIISAIPRLIAEGESAPLIGRSVEPVLANTTHVFYGVSITYRENLHASYNHTLTIFNRCYGVSDQQLVPVDHVRGPAGAQLDCLSNDYLSRGVVSDTAVLVHDFQDTQHAFPAAEKTEFWSMVVPKAPGGR